MTHPDDLAADDLILRARDARDASEDADAPFAPRDEVNEADAAEQALEVPVPDDDYR